MEETESKDQDIGKAPEDIEDSFPLPLSLVPMGKTGEWGWRGGGCQEACTSAQLSVVHMALCVSIFRGPVGNLSVLVAAWESPLGKVLKIHSIVVYY